MTSISDAFNKGYHKFSTSGPFILTVEQGGLYYRYDFAQRVLSAYFSSGIAVTPFSQLDREALTVLRDKLVELGGTPPELPAEAQTGPQHPRNRLNP